MIELARPHLPIRLLSRAVTPSRLYMHAESASPHPTAPSISQAAGKHGCSSLSLSKEREKNRETESRQKNHYCLPLHFAAPAPNARREAEFAWIPRGASIVACPHRRRQTRARRRHRNFGTWKLLCSFVRQVESDFENDFERV